MPYRFILSGTWSYVPAGGQTHRMSHNFKRIIFASSEEAAIKESQKIVDDLKKDYESMKELIVDLELSTYKMIKPFS